MAKKHKRSPIAPRPQAAMYNESPTPLKPVTSWSELTLTRLRESILWPNEQLKIFWLKCSTSARTAQSKKNDNIKLVSWFDVAAGLIVGALTIDLPFTLLMVATTNIIYGNNLNTSPFVFISTIAAAAIQSTYISSLNFGLRNMLRKEENGNLMGGLIGGFLDRYLRFPNSSTTTLLLGALNGATYEVFRPEILHQNQLIDSIKIFSLIEGIDSAICNVSSGSEVNAMFKSLATDILLGVYLATCINMLTIPYGNTIKRPIVFLKDKLFDTFTHALSTESFAKQEHVKTH